MPSRSQTPSEPTTTPQTESSAKTSSRGRQLPATKGGLKLAGVEICKPGEVLTEEEVHRRFKEARESLWKKAEDKGILPTPSTKKP